MNNLSLLMNFDPSKTETLFYKFIIYGYIIDISNIIAKSYVKYQETQEFEFPVPSRIFDNLNLSKKPSIYILLFETMKKDFKIVIDIYKKNKRLPFLETQQNIEEKELTFRIYSHIVMQGKIAKLLEIL